MPRKAVRMQLLELRYCRVTCNTYHCGPLNEDRMLRTESIATSSAAALYGVRSCIHVRALEEHLDPSFLIRIRIL